ncbi:MAG: prepilin peptidase [Lachnospiraceae bacterium]|nr:prepilin peptidase [Lachnospiraceae bacterium]
MECDYLLCLFLVCCACFDIKTDRIPNRLNLAGLICGLCLSAACNGISVLPSRLLWAVLPAAVLMIFFKYRVLGAGDIKLLCVCGAFAGRRVIKVAALMFLLTALYGVIRLIIHALKGVYVRQKVHMSVPALAGMVILCVSEQLYGA